MMESCSHWRFSQWLAAEPFIFVDHFTCQLQDLSARSELATPVHFFWHRQTRVGSWSNTCLSVVIAVVAGPLIILRGRSKNVFSMRFSRKELWYLLWDSLSKYRTFLREPTRRACHEHDGGLFQANASIANNFFAGPTYPQCAIDALGYPGASSNN
jgi:hypothetical protein